MSVYDSDVDEFEARMKKRAARGAAVGGLVTAAMVTLGIFVLVTLVANATPDPARAILAVDKAGFSDARVIESGIVTFRCSGSDSFYYRIAAKNAKGDPTEVTVCCGVLKYCTIRY